MNERGARLFIYREEKHAMGSATDPSQTTACPTCGNPIQTAGLPEHLLADVRMLRIIKATHPGWSSQECEDHWRAICGTTQEADWGERH